MDIIFYLPRACDMLNELEAGKVQRVNLQVSMLVWDDVCDMIILKDNWL